ncbi:predicted protein [Histoplasma mississippiense (nom. inval.)]|uniref:predicted protein n=1 Tax=Ajellomyces capsulatus (strain NAm1 / WU24) TaxID=2059318 RepID=UPI000157B724|nr:predicted protein [Histoplasma mississippiense (nom. inval.)]EDN03423.1 predicted protein [Histoplasma mississippiense (nom. inval.)]
MLSKAKSGMIPEAITFAISKKVPNLEIYGRMGFKFAKEMECHDGEDVCKLYCMTREPKYPSKTMPFKDC